MSRILRQLDVGTPIMIKEYGEDVEYILVSKDSYSCQLLRKTCLVAKRMNATADAVYTDCEMDQWLSSDDSGGFLERFDAATQFALASRNISTYTYGDTDCHYISRKAYLPSYGELFGNGPTTLEPDSEIVGALMAYYNKTDSSSVRIGLNPSGSAVFWWLRSAYSASYFWSVGNNGNAYGSSATSTGHWCRPVLSVASATVVSPEGASIIYLLPVVGHREVEFKGLVGTSDVRPHKCCVKYSAIGLNNVSVKVCNNYGDDNPDWVDATAGTDVNLTNTTKQTTHWEIGIHCYGDTDSSVGYFKEPIVMVEV